MALARSASGPGGLSINTGAANSPLYVSRAFSVFPLFTLQWDLNFEVLRKS